LLARQVSFVIKVPLDIGDQPFEPPFGAMVAGELAGTHDCNHSNTTPIRRSLRQTTRHGNVRPSLGKTSVNFSDV
jgi:hypothetical protein